jgi:two-component system, cell cycle response regulator
MVTRRPGRALCAAYLLIGALGLLLYYVSLSTPGRGWFQLLVFLSVSAGSAAALCFGVFRYQPYPMLPWVLMAVAQVLYAVADSLFFTTYHLDGGREFLPVAELLYLSHYPFEFAGVLLLVLRRLPANNKLAVIDAAVVAVVSAMLLWLYLISPAASPHLPGGAVVSALSCPLMDLAVLAIGTRLLLDGGTRPPALLLLWGNMALMLTADTTFVVQQLSGTFQIGTWLDGLWLAGNVLIGAAALHPTMANLGNQAKPTHETLSPVRLAALCTAVLIAPVTLLIQDEQGQLSNASTITIAAGVLFTLITVRLTGLLADQRRLANTDPLTGLPTRRSFEAYLSKQLSIARRTGYSVGVLMIDVDRFKQVNDHYGHPAGDQALVHIAARLRYSARPDDLLVRYGGEEFAFILPDINEAALRTVAERIRQHVSNSPLELTPGAIRVLTVSIGAASFPQHGRTTAKLVESADQALYAAKRTGRDRVLVSNRNLPTALIDDNDPILRHLCHIADQVDDNLSAYEHSSAVSRWSGLLCAELGGDAAAVHRASIAGRLHDIGKIVLSSALLNKPARLTDDEWAQMRCHPESGARLVSTMPSLAPIARIIEQHHERFDGTGYPARLAGNDIVQEARIIAVCDAWAAMRTNRPYQDAFPLDTALDELHRGRGTQFDPAVVDAFLLLQQRGLIDHLRCRRPQQPMPIPPARNAAQHDFGPLAAPLRP